MTRFSERLRLRWLFPKPTRFLALVSLSTLHHLCKSLVRFLLSQTLPFLAMDNFFSDYLSDDFDSSPYRPHRRFLQDHDLDFAHERVYLLPYRYLPHSIILFIICVRENQKCLSDSFNCLHWKFCSFLWEFDFVVLVD